MAGYATKTDVEEIVQRAIVADVQRIVDNAVNKTVTKLPEIIANFAQQVAAR